MGNAICNLGWMLVETMGWEASEGVSQEDRQLFMRLIEEEAALADPPISSAQELKTIPEAEMYGSSIDTFA